MQFKCSQQVLTVKSQEIQNFTFREAFKKKNSKKSDIVTKGR